MVISNSMLTALLIKGKSRPTDCGGVLRNSDGFVVGVFFGLLGCQESNFTELIAILYALRRFASSLYNGSNLIIESNSKVALSWINNKSQQPWNFDDAFLHSLGHVTLSHILREGNGK